LKTLRDDNLRLHCCKTVLALVINEC